jgi:hypothetical protein
MGDKLASKLQPGDVFWAGPSLPVRVTHLSDLWRGYGRTMITAYGRNANDGIYARVDMAPDTEVMLTSGTE